MKKIVFFLVPMLMLNSCNAQNDKKDKNEEIKPKIDYKVNKKYDENGNLIGYDSTYTYYYSNIDQDAMINDSVFSKFNEHFGKIDPFDDEFFNSFFKQDEYSKEEFFRDDFFREHFKENQKIMEEMLKQMDALKNSYLQEEFPIKENEKDLKQKT